MLGRVISLSMIIELWFACTTGETVVGAAGPAPVERAPLEAVPVAEDGVTP